MQEVYTEVLLFCCIQDTLYLIFLLILFHFRSRWNTRTVYPTSRPHMTVAHLPQAITMMSQHQTGALPLPPMTKLLTDPSPIRMCTHGHLERNRRRTILTRAVLRRIITTGDNTTVNTNNQCPRAPHIAMVVLLTVIQRQITTMHEGKQPGKNGFIVLLL